MNVRVMGVLVAGLLASMGAGAAGDAAKGAETATAVCAACHGPDGNSVITTNPKLAGQFPEYLAKQLNEFKSGKRANAVMGPMSATLTTPEDVLNVAAYFAAQAPKGGAAKSNGKGSDGERIYKGGILAKGVPACASCHSPNGAGIPVQFPRLAGQHAEYNLNQLKAFRSGERANAPMMRVIASKMSDPEMEAVVDYIQGLK
ncbi:MAG TPA: c-type cytochrome [Methylophilaceae bacterium]|nr:c-type cytochrome [Methylophilaceae bacterium]HQR59756.1 c-type cytochrome [Methylophilaceae bacterium]